jgi:hypothetical protein
MERLERLKKLAASAYSATIRAESHYAFAVRQYREAVLQRELERDPKLLTPYGWSGYSQNDEDGIVHEIFRRIGTTNRRFLEFGAGDPLFNTGTYQLLSGWSGVWAEASADQIADIEAKFRAWIESGNLLALKTFITPENINDLMSRQPPDLDFLVIDVDGNDYHIWKAMHARPRVIMIEYNATFRPPAAVIQPYMSEPFWQGENFYGASLKALEYLSFDKGYCLVGCNFVGTNAFFVRQDLVKEHFSPPYTAQHHYREQCLDSMTAGYMRQLRSAGPGVRYEIVDPPAALE